MYVSMQQHLRVCLFTDIYIHTDTYCCAYSSSPVDILASTWSLSVAYQLSLQWEYPCPTLKHLGWIPCTHSNSSFLTVQTSTWQNFPVCGTPGWSAGFQLFPESSPRHGRHFRRELLHNNSFSQEEKKIIYTGLCLTTNLEFVQGRDSVSFLFISLESNVPNKYLKK